MAWREWARKLIDKQPMARGGDSVDGNAAIKLLKAEHARAVRIVKKKIRSLEACIASDKRDGNEAGATLHVYALSICNTLLGKLQRGRGGKG